MKLLALFAVILLPVLTSCVVEEPRRAVVVVSVPATPNNPETLVSYTP